MEKRLELEKRGKNPADVVDLNLDNSRSATIVGLSDEYVSLETLSMINVGLTSLKGFPKLPKLKRLELSDNRISGGLELLHGSPNLTSLNLSGNKIREFEKLKPLSEFKFLEILDLYNCEVTQIESYREKVFNLIPSLRFLDGFDSEDREKSSDDEDYSDNDPADEELSSEDDEDDDDDDEDLDEKDEEDDGDDDGEDADEEESDDEEADVGLDQLAASDIDEEPEGNDFEPGEEVEDDEDFDDDEVEEKKDDASRGQKRKHDDDDDE